MTSKRYGDFARSHSLPLYTPEHTAAAKQRRSSALDISTEPADPGLFDHFYGAKVCSPSSSPTPTAPSSTCSSTSLSSPALSQDSASTEQLPGSIVPPPKQPSQQDWWFRTQSDKDCNKGTMQT
eukprot:CAMPEP_0196720660 /NCGR_PEP_ID=MMETSP1091-20130531/3405_1 /TAXON_ID=302021 /ORGANISM="Rhodomonas sp., Strain CCMP768" /LENGTH=123 /DNA_ID=CAMNT_0042061961 /DNA_START=134 /DNA_END=505 /DNA_ORIENTATION=+